MSNRPTANVSFPVDLVTMRDEPQRWTISGHVEPDEDGIMFTPLSATLTERDVTLSSPETVEFPDSFDRTGADANDAWWLFAERFRCDTDGKCWEGDTFLSDVVNALADKAYIETLRARAERAPQPAATFVGPNDDPFGQEEPF